MSTHLNLAKVAKHVSQIYGVVIWTISFMLTSPLKENIHQIKTRKCRHF